MEVKQFITESENKIREIRKTAMAEFSALDMATLNHKEHSEKWSILECLEHLNRYHQYYYPLLYKAFSNGSRNTLTAQPSWIGQKFIKMMLPENTKKMKTLKHMNPQLTASSSQKDRSVLDTFLQNQDELLHLVTMAGQTDLNKKRIPVEFFKLIKMRTWEALTFLITHEQRHLAQALRAKSAVTSYESGY